MPVINRSIKSVRYRPADDFDIGTIALTKTGVPVMVTSAGWVTNNTKPTLKFFISLDTGTRISKTTMATKMGDGESFTVANMTKGEV